MTPDFTLIWPLSCLKDGVHLCCISIRRSTPRSSAALLHEDPLRVAAWPALLGLSAGATLRGCVDGNSGSDHKHSFLIGLGTRVRVLAARGESH